MCPLIYYSKMRKVVRKWVTSFTKHAYSYFQQYDGYHKGISFISPESHGELEYRNQVCLQVHENFRPEVDQWMSGSSSLCYTFSARRETFEPCYRSGLAIAVSLLSFLPQCYYSGLELRWVCLLKSGNPRCWSWIVRLDRSYRKLSFLGLLDSYWMW